MRIGNALRTLLDAPPETPSADNKRDVPRPDLCTDNVKANASVQHFSRTKSTKSREVD
jgi:hypothetical protein